MNNKPILFSTPMVQAIIEGRKTQTRRIVKPQPPEYARLTSYHPVDYMAERFRNKISWFIEEAGDLWPCNTEDAIKNPYVPVGGYLWVRETWAPLTKGYAYKADPFINSSPSGKWHPSIHMPKAASRITLLVKGIRVEKLQDISEEDAIDEGIERVGGDASVSPWRNYRISEPSVKSLHCSAPSRSFMALWESINGQGSWSVNPWVWVIEFDLILKNINDVIDESCQTSK